jgi:5-methylcytosine-specific restriction protein A
MPHFLAGPCRFRGCPKRAEHDGFCLEHRRQRNREYNRERRSNPATTDRFYTSTRWLRLRKAKLQANPLCETCAPRVVAATIVDHKRPIKHGGDAYDWDNLQSQCDSCHSRKSVQEGSRWRKT